MSMMKKHFAETRNTKKEIKTVEFDGLMPWSPENGLMPCGVKVTEENNDDTNDGLMHWDPENGCHLENEVTEKNNDDGLIPWGTPAQHEAAKQALVRHFAY